MLTKCGIVCLACPVDCIMLQTLSSELWFSLPLKVCKSWYVPPEEYEAFDGSLRKHEDVITGMIFERRRDNLVKCV